MSWCVKKWWLCLVGHNNWVTIAYAKKSAPDEKPKMGTISIFYRLVYNRKLWVDSADCYYLR